MPWFLEKLLAAVFTSFAFWICMFAIIFIAIGDFNRSKQNGKGEK